MSLFNAISQASTLGLEIDGVLGQAYLVPYGNECTLQVGYRGLIAMCRRSGEISTIQMAEVYDCDSFTYQLGDDAFIRHQPDDQNPDRESRPITHVYVIVELKDGGKQRSVWGKGKIDSHMRKYSPSHNSPDSPWKTAYVTMAKKTVIKDMINRGVLPVSAEVIRLSMKEEIVESSTIEGTVINAQGAGDKMQKATAMLQSMVPQEEPVEEEEVETVAPDTALSLADQAQAVVEAIPTISGFWNEARKKRNTSTLRDHYDLISADPELTSDERDGLLSLRKIREAQLSTSTQKTLV
jgi:phage RecT family recombinase